jgi:hypothetical protein
MRERKFAHKKKMLKHLSFQEQNKQLTGDLAFSFEHTNPHAIICLYHHNNNNNTNGWNRKTRIRIRSYLVVKNRSTFCIGIWLESRRKKKSRSRRKNKEVQEPHKSPHQNRQCHLEHIQHIENLRLSSSLLLWTHQHLKYNLQDVRKQRG